MENFDKTFESLYNIGDALEQIQDKVSNITACGKSGAEDVKAYVNGKRELVKIEILDDSLLCKSKKEILQDLITGAINEAMTNVTHKIKTEVVPNSVLDLISDMSKK